MQKKNKQATIADVPWWRFVYVSGGVLLIFAGTFFYLHRSENTQLERLSGAIQKKPTPTLVYQKGDEIKSRNSPVLETAVGSQNFPKPIAFLRSEVGVLDLLSSENRDVEALFQSASTEKIELIRRGAYKTVEVLADCLLDKKDCGYDKRDWQTYYAIGGPQPFYMLERALNFLLTSWELGNEKHLQIEMSELIELMGLRVQSTSILASSLALKSAMNESEALRVIDSYERLNFQALPLFFEMSLAEAQGRGQEKVISEVKNKVIQLFIKEDYDRGDELLPYLARMEMSEAELIRIANALCVPRGARERSDVHIDRRRKAALKKQFELSNLEKSFPAACRNY